MNRPVPQTCPTKRAPDVWESAAFSSIFLASGFSCSQTESTPAHTQVTQTVGQPLALNLLRGFQNWLSFKLAFESSKSGFGFQAKFQVCQSRSF